MPTALYLCQNGGVRSPHASVGLLVAHAQQRAVAVDDAASLAQVTAGTGHRDLVQGRCGLGSQLLRIVIGVALENTGVQGLIVCACPHWIAGTVAVFGVTCQIAESVIQALGVTILARLGLEATHPIQCTQGRVWAGNALALVVAGSLEGAQPAACAIHVADADSHAVEAYAGQIWGSCAVNITVTLLKARAVEAFFLVLALAALVAADTVSPANLICRAIGATLPDTGART